MKTTHRQTWNALARGLVVAFVMAQLFLSAACSYHRTDVDMLVLPFRRERTPETRSAPTNCTKF